MEIKIQPYKLLPVQNTPINEGNHTCAKIPVSLPVQNESPKQIATLGNAYLPVNIESNETTEFIKNLHKLKNIHCPVCGVKMLSFNEFRDLLNEGSEITDSKEFINWLDKHKDNIPKKHLPFLNFIKESYKKSPINDTTSFLNYCKSRSLHNTEKALAETIKILNEAKQTYNFSESDHVLLDECEIRLKEFNVNSKGNIYRSVKKILRDTIHNLENENRFILSGEMIKKYVPAALQQNIFMTSKRTVTEENSFQRRVLENLFDRSFSNVNSLIAKYNENCDPAYNKILCCQDCSLRIPKTSHLLAFYKTKENLENNLTQYLEDIGVNILAGNLPGHSDYMFGLANLISNISSHAINPCKYDYSNEIFRNVKIKQFYDNLEKIDFAPVYHENIPCACCGSTTMTHAQKLKIYDEITNADSLENLIQIMNENKKLINYRYRYFLRLMNETLEANPEISDDEIIDLCRKDCADEIKKQLQINLASANLIKNTMNDEDKELLQKFIDSVNENFLNLKHDQLFPYKEYANLIKETVSKIENPQFKKEFALRYKESIRKKYATQITFFPFLPISQKVGSEIKVIIQDIFNSSTATVDHIISRNRNGLEDKINYMILCKSCNHEKANYSILKLKQIHPALSKNMQKYVTKLTELVNNNEISEDYKFYIRKFCRFINLLSKNQIVLYYNFNDGISKDK